MNGKDKKDITPLLYLGVALSKTRGKAQKAVEVFNEAFGYTLEKPGTRTELWSRAYMSRLLRRMDRVREAETQEKLIRSEDAFLVTCTKAKARIPRAYMFGIVITYSARVG